jgi:hypothetical protein
MALRIELQRSYRFPIDLVFALNLSMHDTDASGISQTRNVDTTKEGDGHAGYESSHVGAAHISCAVNTPLSRTAELSKRARVRR